TSASVSARSAPARAIPSISASDLRTIIGRLRADRARRATKTKRCKNAASVRRPASGFDLTVSLRLGQRVLDLPEDLFDGAVGMDAHDVRLVCAVVLDERCRFLVVELEPPPYGLGRVVGAPLRRGPRKHPLQE